MSIGLYSWLFLCAIYYPNGDALQLQFILYFYFLFLQCIEHLMWIPVGNLFLNYCAVISIFFRKLSCLGLGCMQRWILCQTFWIFSPFRAKYFHYLSFINSFDVLFLSNEHSCNLQLQVSLSMYDLLLDTRH